jgi:hypothetical protein
MTMKLVASFGLGLLTGAAGLALALLGLHSLFHGRAGVAIALGSTPLVVGVFAIADRRERLIGSTWRVPRSWGRFGGSSFALLFGAALGFGWLTALPGPLIFALPFWAGVLSPLALCASAAGFALGRFAGSVLPAVVSVCAIRFRDRPGEVFLGQIGEVQRHLRTMRPLQALVLGSCWLTLLGSVVS